LGSSDGLQLGLVYLEKTAQIIAKSWFFHVITLPLSILHTCNIFQLFGLKNICLNIFHP
jgi:hypothetical protein